MMLPKKTSLAIATLGAMLLLLESAKLARPFTLADVLDFRPRDIPNVEPLAPMPTLKGPVTAFRRPIIEPNLIDPHDNLRPFYLALWRTELGAPGAITRVLHYGDSPVTADSITADVRSLLQQHFGDAGHGFVLIAKPWAWYGHRGVEVQGKGWLINAATQVRARDGFHGLGGVSFEGDTGASSRLTLAEDHAFQQRPRTLAGMLQRPVRRRRHSRRHGDRLLRPRRCLSRQQPANAHAKVQQSAARVPRPEK